MGSRGGRGYRGREDETGALPLAIIKWLPRQNIPGCSRRHRLCSRKFPHEPREPPRSEEVPLGGIAGTPGRESPPQRSGSTPHESIMPSPLGVWVTAI